LERGDHKTKTGKHMVIEGD